MKLEDRFRSATKRSFDLYQRARKVALNGVQASSKHLAPYPIFLKEANGSKVKDVDGHSYIDYILGFGPLIVGHGHPAVMEKVKAQIEEILLSSYPVEVEVELAEKIVKHVPSAELVRFTASGTEANMLGIRLARAYTGRDYIIRFRGDFMGWADSLIPGLVTTASAPGGVKPVSTAGIPDPLVERTITVEFNDIDAVAGTMKELGRKVAAIFTEASFRSVIMPRPGYLEGLRELCDKYGSLLFFDEIVSGFRFGLGGAQAYFGVSPDLNSLGKALGGGFPIGALVGRAEIMERASISYPDRAKMVYHSSTWPGYPIAMAAGLATIELLEKGGAYEKLFAAGERLKAAMNEICQELSLPIRVIGPGPVLAVAFTDDEIVNLDSAKCKVEPQKINQFRLAMLTNGVLVLGEYLPACKLYLSLAHKEEDLRETAEAFEKSLLEIF